MQRAADANCPFCAVVGGRLPATMIHADAHTVAFLDLRQYHPGHVLVIPRAHVPDIRAADEATVAAVLVMVSRVARAVDAAFPGDGVSVWHAAGPGATQEVPHLHFHVHPRRMDDGLLRVYPRAPARPDRGTLEAWGARLRAALDRAGRAAPE